MKIVIGSDHAGCKHKEYLSRTVSSLGHSLSDAGVCEGKSADYPDIAEKVAGAVAAGDAELGILLCGSGIGASMAANKVRGIRAALCWDKETARLAREHNDANILCMGARLLSMDVCEEIAKVFLSQPYSGQERHNRRIKKIRDIEERNCTVGRKQ